MKAAVDDSANLWLAGKTAALVGRLAQSDWDRWPRASEILDCMIGGGARSMRLQRRIGQITPGFEADLIMIDLNSLAYLPLNNLERQWSFARMAFRAADHGRRRDRHGERAADKARRSRSPGRDSRGDARECRHLPAIEAHAQTLLPYYRAMVQRAHAQDIGMMRVRVPDFRSGKDRSHNDILNIRASSEYSGSKARRIDNVTVSDPCIYRI